MNELGKHVDDADDWPIPSARAHASRPITSSSDAVNVTRLRNGRGEPA